MPGATWPVVGLRPGFPKNVTGPFAASCFLLPLVEWDSLASILQTRQTLPTVPFLRKASSLWASIEETYLWNYENSINDVMLTRFIL